MIAKLKKALEQKTCWEESVELISSVIVGIKALQARKAELNQGIIDRDSIIFKHVRRIERLEKDNIKLQSLWVTVNLSCNPPDDCNDPKILKEYMKECIAKANEYEQPNGPKDLD